MMFRRRSGVSRTARPNSGRSLNLEVLEARQLLAVDLGIQLDAVPAEELLPITDPFARDAVTFEQMASRAAKHSYVPDELLVAVASPAGMQSRSADLVDWSTELGDFEVEPIKTIMSFENTETTTFSLVQLNLGAGADVVEAMRSLDAHDHVLWSSPNFVFEGDDPRDLIPNDPRYGNQYHHPLIGNVDAWDISVGSADIVIGITDDGVDLQHEDLQQAIWTNPAEIAGNGVDDDANGYVDDVNGYNFLNNNNNPDATGSNDHGTHVAGISAAGLDNGIGTAGTAGGATILPLKWYGGGSWTAAIIAETFTYAADNGADIVNTSYNMDGWANDPVVHAAFDYMYAAGVLHFNSAGNGSSANPARQVFEQTLLVVSTESNDTKSSFSNWGTGVDISAPGGSILSTTPNNTYSTFSGTSMAAPNAAGVAALIWSAHPDWTREQVVARLQGTADNIDTINPTYAGLLGAGRVNSFQALDPNVTLAAPTIENVDGVPPGGSASAANPITGFDIDFDQLMDAASVLDPANYELLDAGPDGMFETLDDDMVGLTLQTTEYLVGSGGIELDIDGGALGIGNYRFTIRSGGITNPFGTALDGDGNGVAGQDYQAVFSVGLEPFIVTGLLGSLGSASVGNPGTLSSATDSDSYPFFVEAGESVAAIIRAGDPGVKLTAEFVGIGSSVTATNPGDDIILPLTEVGADGNVMLSITGDGSSSYQFDIYRNVNSEALIETAGPVDINDSLLQLGSGRFAALGRSTGSDGGVQFLQSSDASAFIDISGTGAALGLSDDGEANITTTVGNSIFPSGSVTVGNNGVIVAGGGEEVPYINGAIPTSSFGNALLPFWDDIDADSGDVYWEERSVGGIDTLIVQWHNRPHFSNVGSSTFQLQLFETGPLRARYAYQDVDFDSGTYDGGASATIGYQSSSISGMQYSLNSAVIANGDIIDIFALAPTTDVDEFEFDLQANQQIDVAVAGLSQSAGSETIELVDARGTVLATASDTPSGISVQNFDQGILGYQVPTTATYTVRVSSDRLFDYTLLISEDLVYDTEANDTVGSASRSLDNVNGALGYLEGGGQDVYSLTLAANEVVNLATSTPLDHVNHLPANTLDPGIIVFNGSGTQLAADSNSADGKNASLDFTAPSAGTYYVAVANEGGAGDYVLNVTNATVVDGDFNDDGFYDCDDIDALTAEIASDATFDDLAYDLTGDGLVDLADRDAWLAEAATANGFASPYLLGDADLNGVVDGEDFLEWNTNKFTSATDWCQGDFNADAMIDGADFLLWNANKFQSSEAQVLPEVAADFGLASGGERALKADLFVAEVKPQAVAAPAAPSVRITAADATFALYGQPEREEERPSSVLEGELQKLI